MFEQYTDKARRVIYVARFEASEFGRSQIEADFILLGIAHEDPALCVEWLGENYEELHKKFARIYATGERVKTSADLPLSSDAKRVLAYASEEAERAASPYVKPEHLLIGLFREPGCAAAKMMTARGEDLAAVRALIAAEREPSRMREKPSDEMPLGALFRRLRMVDEEGREIAAVAMRGGRIPNVGEAVSIPDSQSVVASYRILDVTWEAKSRSNSTLQVVEVILKVVKD